MQDADSQIDLSAIVLTRGSHLSADQGLSLLEAVCIATAEDVSDSPSCVDPILAAFGRSWNEGMRSDNERAQLKQYIMRLPSETKSVTLSQRLGWMAADWLIRVHVPAWLSLLPSLVVHADAIRAESPLASVEDLQRIQPLLNAANLNANGVAVVAVDADWSIPWDAARAAGLTAARDAASTAGIGPIWGAVWTAGWAAAYKGLKGALADQLEPTVQELQASAHQLFSSMIDRPEAA